MKSDNNCIIVIDEYCIFQAGQVNLHALFRVNRKMVLTKRVGLSFLQLPY